MDQSGSGIVDGKGGMISEVPGQAIDQSAGEISMAGMNHHAGRFVHHQQHLILVDDVQWQLFRNEDIVPGWCGDQDHHFIHGLHPVIGFDGLAIHQDTTGIGSVLYTVSGNVLDSIDQKFVDPEQRLTGIGLEAVFFKAITRLFLVVSIIGIVLQQVLVFQCLRMQDNRWGHVRRGRIFDQLPRSLIR